jgi:NTP pyrophosphatase (non-canonical NTP hydrolase)
VLALQSLDLGGLGDTANHALYAFTFAFEQYLQWRQEANIIHAEFLGGRWPVNSNEDKRFLALALCGEAGELANMVKKLWRGDKIPLIDIWKELADVRIYLELLVVAFDCNLDATCIEKLKEVQQRLHAKKAEASV